MDKFPELRFPRTPRIKSVANLKAGDMVVAVRHTSYGHNQPCLVEVRNVSSSGVLVVGITSRITERSRHTTLYEVTPEVTAFLERKKRILAAARRVGVIYNALQRYMSSLPDLPDSVLEAVEGIPDEVFYG